MSPIITVTRRKTLAGLAALLPLSACKTLPTDPSANMLSVRQGLPIIQDIIAAGRPNRPQKTIRPAWVTVHSTSNTTVGADAAAHARFVKHTGFYTLSSGQKNYVSWHFTVDDAEIYQHLPTNEKGWHAGRGNAVSIGIEICMNQGIDQDEAIRKTAALVASTLYEHRIPLRNVVQHHYWTSKNCPIIMRTPEYSQIDWLLFQRMVNKEIKALERVRGQRVIDDFSSVVVSDGAGEVDIDHALLAAQLM